MILSLVGRSFSDLLPLSCFHRPGSPLMKRGGKVHETNFNLGII